MTVIKDIKGKTLKKDQVVKILNKSIKAKSTKGFIESTSNNDLYISIPDEKYGSMDFTWKNWNKEVEIIGDIHNNPKLLNQFQN